MKKGKGFNLFKNIQVKKPPVNAFDLSHGFTFTGNFGKLIPICCIDALPGDTYKMRPQALVRFSSLVSPALGKFNWFIHYYFVPKRIIWEGWEDFITNTDAGTGVPTMPYVTMNLTRWQMDKLADYMGVPNPTGGNEDEINILPFSAYQTIYNEYYRDQNLIAELETKIGYSGGNQTSLWDPTFVTLRKRAWEHDYLTSALPFAQKGSPVTIPIADVQNVPVNLNIAGAGSTTLDGTPNDAIVGIEPTSDPLIGAGTLYANTDELNINNATINDLRTAYRLQEFLEKDARSGSRYFEKIRAHFGVKPSDARLQRPEYITGVKTPVQISEVLQTAPPLEGQTPLATMAGHGVSLGGGNYGQYFCPEHGYIIGIFSIMPKAVYPRSIPKHFTKLGDWTEHGWPEFGNLGEQPILNKEVYAFDDPAVGVETFGYIPRYAEYKSELNRVAGDFRGGQALDFWVPQRDFATTPELNQDFIEMDNASADDIFAVTDPEEDKIYVDVWNEITAVRRLPKFGTPLT